MRRPGVTLAGFLVLVGLCALWGAAPTEAHERSIPVVVEAPAADPAPVALPEERPLAWKSAPALPGVPWVALLALAVSTAVGARRPRRTLALALVLVLALFAFETGRHSVHHLSDRGPASCAISLVSQHEAGALADCIAIAAPRVIVGPGLHPSHPGTSVIRSLGPDQSRAPPARPA
jgi:hypothetical protein